MLYSRAVLGRGVCKLKTGQKVKKALRRVTGTDGDGLGMLIWENTKGGYSSCLHIFEGLSLRRGIWLLAFREAECAIRKHLSWPQRLPATFFPSSSSVLVGIPEEHSPGLSLQQSHILWILSK